MTNKINYIYKPSVSIEPEAASKGTDKTDSGYVFEKGLYFRGHYRRWKEGMLSAWYITIFFQNPVEFYLQIKLNIQTVEWIIDYNFWQLSSYIIHHILYAIYMFRASKPTQIVIVSTINICF